MFTIDQIEEAHAKVKSGADFPGYIQAIKTLGVQGFETWVVDSHTIYFGANDFRVISRPKYEVLSISEKSNQTLFIAQLKEHQQGKTDYFKFCQDCAVTGIEKWVVRLDDMTCTYYDRHGHEVLIEQIPAK